MRLDATERPKLSYAGPQVEDYTVAYRRAKFGSRERGDAPGADTTVRARLAEIGQEVPPPDQQTPEALGEFQRAEAEKWWPILKAANVKGE